MEHVLFLQTRQPHAFIQWVNMAKETGVRWQTDIFTNRTMDNHAAFFC